MSKLAASLILAGIASVAFPAVGQVERQRPPGDKTGGEQQQIEAREEWFINQRGLDTVARPDLIRANAINDLKFALSQPQTRVVPGSWVSMGPSPLNNVSSWVMGRVAGRVSALAVHPSNEQTLFLGTAAGGLWRTTDGGTSWSSAFDTVGTQTIGSVVFDPNNSATVWVGTGGHNPIVYNYFGMGLFRSQDGGSTFQPRNGSGGTALSLSRIVALAVQPGNSNLVLAGGGCPCAGGPPSGDGLYRTIDGGSAWTKVLNGSIADVIFDPVVPSTVFAAVDGATPGAGVYRSFDGGASWSQLAGGLPGGASFSRARLAMAPGNRFVLYALIASSSTQAQIYRTVDGGGSWALRNNAACFNEGTAQNPVGQCLYNLALAISPASSDTLIVGTMRFRRSTDGGTTLGNPITNAWGSTQQAHQDTHVLRYSATNGNRFWIGSDGGLWRTDNGGGGFVNLNGNLNITQLYDVAVHPTDSNRIYGGAQDNSSSWRTTTSIWNVISPVTGDGFVNAYDQGNTNYIFIESYPDDTGRPQIYRSTNGGGGFSTLTPIGISAADAPFPWVTQLAMLYGGTSSYILTGSRYVYRANARQSAFLTLFGWTAISGDLTSGAAQVSAFGISRSTGNTIYVGFSNGRVFRSLDILGNVVSWTEVTANLPFAYVSDLAVDPANRLRVYVTHSTFFGNKLYRSTTGGGSWTPVGAGLPDVPANTVAIDPINRQRVFVGTDVGVYVSEDGGDTFSPQMSGLPLGTVITDLEIDNSPHVLTAATFGRGAWQLALPSETGPCVPDGGVDDLLQNTGCCSGVAVQGSSFCPNPSDLPSCGQICGTPLVGGCVPSGGVDDIKSSTSCCSGAAVPGSAWCLDPADYGTDWISCTQICQ